MTTWQAFAAMLSVPTLMGIVLAWRREMTHREIERARERIRVAADAQHRARLLQYEGAARVLPLRLNKPRLPAPPSHPTIAWPPQPPPDPIHDNHSDELRALPQHVGGYRDAAPKPLQDQVDELRARIDELEARGAKR